MSKENAPIKKIFEEADNWIKNNKKVSVDLGFIVFNKFFLNICRQDFWFTLQSIPWADF